MSDRLDEIEAREGKATPGPWYARDVAFRGFTTGPDAEFIANARDDVPWLIAEVRRRRPPADVLAAAAVVKYGKGTRNEALEYAAVLADFVLAPAGTETGRDGE